MAKITVQNTQITVIKQNEDDYISLTDMLKAKDGEFFFSNWLRNRNTIEFLGIWERLMNPNFNCAEFDIIKLEGWTLWWHLRPQGHCSQWVCPPVLIFT